MVLSLTIALSKPSASPFIHHFVGLQPTTVANTANLFVLRLHMYPPHHPCGPKSPDGLQTVPIDISYPGGPQSAYRNHRYPYGTQPLPIDIASTLVAKDI